MSRGRHRVGIPAGAGAGAPGPRAPGEPSGSRAVSRLLGQGLSAGILLLVLGLALLVVVIPRVTGATPLTVLTSSMEPGLPPGTLIIVRPVDPDALAISDVITYQIRSGSPEVITHRIISIGLGATGDRTFVLQGDNNSSPDAQLVIPEQVQGRLWYSVPLLGYVNTLVTEEVKTWVAPVAALLLFGYSSFMVAGAVRDARRKRGKISDGSRSRSRSPQRP